jgi:SAM-dependent methyltransferase
MYALPDIRRLSRERGGGPVDALDIGCGPISRLRWGALQGLLSITGIDPLLDMYHIVLKRHGLDNLPEICCQRELCIPAEVLSQCVTPGSYDFAFSCNAIDHAEDPPLVVSQVAACLRPGGVFALESNKREGSRNNWAHLHQFDIYFGSDGQLLCQLRDGSSRSLVGEEVGLKLREVVVDDDSYIVVLFEREKEESTSMSVDKSKPPPVDVTPHSHPVGWLRRCFASVRPIRVADVDAP